MKKFIGILVLMASLMAVLMSAHPVLADDSQLFQACQTLAQENKDNKDFKPSPICASHGTTTNPALHIINVATDIVALLAGVAAVTIIIISGITMITSSGNAEAVGNSRKRITNAIIGLAIIALAWTIITFATDKLIQ